MMAYWRFIYIDFCDNLVALILFFIWSLYRSIPQDWRRKQLPYMHWFRAGCEFRLLCISLLTSLDLCYNFNNGVQYLHLSTIHTCIRTIRLNCHEYRDFGDTSVYFCHYTLIGNIYLTIDMKQNQTKRTKIMTSKQMCSLLYNICS